MNLIVSSAARIPKRALESYSYVRPVAGRLLTKRVVFIALAIFALYWAAAYAVRTLRQATKPKPAEIEKDDHDEEIENRAYEQQEGAKLFDTIASEFFHPEDDDLIERLQSPLIMQFNAEDTEVGILCFFTLFERAKRFVPSEALEKAVFEAFFVAKGPEQAALIADPNGSFAQAQLFEKKKLNQTLFTLLPRFAIEMPFDPSIMENDALRDFFMGALESECSKWGESEMKTRYCDYLKKKEPHTRRCELRAGQVDMYQEFHKRLRALCTKNGPLDKKYPKACAVLNKAYEMDQSLYKQALQSGASASL